MTWNEIEFFNPLEFQCPCPCRRSEMDLVFVALLDTCRRLAGIPLIVSAGGGFRCEDYNRSVSGASSQSAHTQGLAADIAAKDSATRSRILWAIADTIDLKDPGRLWNPNRPLRSRLGIYDRHIHVDTSTTLPARVTWVGTST